MLIEDLNLKNFTVHEDSTFKFPERGVVLVTGPNGGGKSSLAEGISWGAFGETLRGSPPGGRKGADPCSVKLTIRSPKSLVVERTRASELTKVRWTLDGKATVHPTTSKAQDSLGSVIGSWETWRRTHVFSSADAAHFTTATDKERKLFLESYLGLERFDTALDLSRNAMRAAESVCETVEREIAFIASEERAATHRLEDAEKVLRDIPTNAAPTDEEEDVGNGVGPFAEHIKKAEEERRQLVKEIAASDGDTGAIKHELKMLTQRLQRLGDTGHCDSCGQVVPKELREELTRKIDAARETIVSAEAASADARRDVEEGLHDVEVALQKLRTKEAAYHERAKAAAKARSQRGIISQMRSRAEFNATNAQEMLAQAATKMVEAREKESKAARELSVFTAAVTVLGMRGVRAALLARMLSSLEASANAWLPRLAGPGISVSLKSYKENKSGQSVSDVIALDVHGVGDGYGYRAASGGERRRIDVAIMLAFAGKGSLIFDEALDALDSAGVVAIADVLEELAQDRCVVVITHNEELATQLPQAIRWKISENRK